MISDQTAPAHQCRGNGDGQTGDDRRQRLHILISLELDFTLQPEAVEACGELGRDRDRDRDQDEPEPRHLQRALQEAGRRDQQRREGKARQQERREAGIHLGFAQLLLLNQRDAETRMGDCEAEIDEEVGNCIKPEFRGREQTAQHHQHQQVGQDQTRLAANAPDQTLDGAPGQALRAMFLTHWTDGTSTCALIRISRVTSFQSRLGSAIGGWPGASARATAETTELRSPGS